MVERADPRLSVSQQCRLLAVSRCSVYRRPPEVSEPDYGSRRMAAWLATQGHLVNRKRVQPLMRLMGLVAIYQRPNTSKPAPGEEGLPVPARRAVDRAGQSGLVRRHHIHPDG